MMRIVSAQLQFAIKMHAHSSACAETTHSLLIHSASSWPGLADAVIKERRAAKIKEEKQSLGNTIAQKVSAAD